MKPPLFTWSQRNLERLPPHDQHSASSSKEYSDPLVIGLKVEVYKTGRKIFRFKSTFRGSKVNLRIGELSASFTLAEARQMAADYRAQIDRGIDPSGEIIRQKAMPTFGEFVEKSYLPWAYVNKRSASADESKFKHHLKARFGSRLLNDITRREVEQYHGAVKASHCAATANRHLALLSIIFNKAIHWDLLEVNVAQGVKKFQEDNQKTDYLNPEEISRLSAALEKEENVTAKSAIHFLLATGCRRQEVLGLRWENVDLQNGLIYLEKTKSGKTRHVPLNDAALAVLTKLKLGRCESEWVFPGKGDGSKQYVNLHKPLARAAAAAGLRRIYPHLLRHSFASMLVSKNVSIYQVQLLLGHSNVTMSQRYSHLASDTLRESSQVVSQLFNPPGSPD